MSRQFNHPNEPSNKGRYNYLKRVNGFFAVNITEARYNELELEGWGESLVKRTRSRDGVEVFYQTDKRTHEGYIDKIAIGEPKFQGKVVKTLEIGMTNNDHFTLPIKNSLLYVQRLCQQLLSVDFSREVRFTSTPLKGKNPSTGAYDTLLKDKDGNIRNGYIWVNYTGDDWEEKIPLAFTNEDVPDWVKEEGLDGEEWNRKDAQKFIYGKVQELIEKFNKFKSENPDLYPVEDVDDDEDSQDSDTPAELESDPIPAATTGKGTKAKKSKKTESPDVEEPMDDLPF